MKQYGSTYKKVILTKEFTGLLFFKSIEIELKPRDFGKNLRRTSTVLRNGLIKIPIFELAHYYYFSQSDWLTILPRSIKFDERQGYLFVPDKSKPPQSEKREEKPMLQGTFEVFLNKTTVDGIIR